MEARTDSDVAADSSGDQRVMVGVSRSHLRTNGRQLVHRLSPLRRHGVVCAMHFYRARYAKRGLGSRNSVRPSVRPSVRLSVRHTRAL